MPESTIFWIGVVCGALILAAVEAAYVFFLCWRAQAMDEEMR